MLTQDEMLDDISLYWLTNTAVSSARVHSENNANNFNAVDIAVSAAGYQYYFATERGRAGYDQYRNDFAKLIWRIASPKWDSDDAMFDRTATAFANPDHVAIVIHNYRWRLGLAAGEARYDALEQRLAEAPVIAVPAITLEGDANGTPHPDAAPYRGFFSGPYAHQVIGGGIGHNLPQEAPQAFAQAILDVSSFIPTEQQQ